MRYWQSLLVAATLTACATAPSGRSQLILFSDEEMNQAGLVAFDGLKQAGEVSNDPRQTAYVGCIVAHLTAELPAEWRATGWEVRVFVDDTPNAIALPGGKVGVNSGMFEVAQNQDQLAAALGHEIAHVVYRHGAERVSQNALAQTGLELAAASGRASPALLQALGLGAQVGVLLPFSRRHKSEADVYGQELMALAGFDPAAAVALWRNMLAWDTSQPLEWLSTHPDPENRIRRLEAAAPGLEPVAQQARAAGRRPRCG